MAEARTPHLGMITGCVMLATIMQALDTTIANVALPYMQGNLSASQDQINWVLTSYIVAAAIMTPPTGWLAARFGRRRLFLISVFGFTIASMLCGAATSLAQIVLYRLLQGVFGAALVPLSQAVLLDSYPPERHGAAMAMWGVGVMVGPVLGPILGGWLTETYTWRWVFYINLPFGILAFLGIATFITETPARYGARFDWFGFGMLSLGVGALQMMLDRGEQKDWFSSTEIITEAVLSAVGFYLFLVQILTSRQPFISPKLFRDRNLSVGLLLIFAVGIILLATLALLTPFLQTLIGYPVFAAGLIQSPRGIGTMFAMLVVGRLVGKVDTRLLLTIGFGLTAASLAWMTTFTADVSSHDLVLDGLLQGAGLGFTFVPLSAMTFSTIAVEFRTEATALYSLMRNLGSSIGISVVSALLASNTQINHALLATMITPYNAALRLPEIARAWNPMTAAGQTALNSVVTREATLIAFIDDYKLMMIVALAVIPLTLLLRQKSRRPAGAPDAGHSAAAALE
ncbi:MAG: DHA2 family efflux MFS transporter permease subunit [Azospirillaceae bacterium]|nr:DHA2 family efflux MFS transporter permease subunit [Azospirillaceae bacterium]